MNTNEKKKTVDHSANLEMFFSRKMEIDKINRKIKRHEKVSKKKRENQLSFDYDKKQFRLVDANNVSAVSVTRIEKKNTKDLMEKNNSNVQNKKQKILDKKYELLFEYQNIEDYETIYKKFIQPHESYIQMHEKTLEDYHNEIKEQEQEYKETKQHILKQQEPYEIELKNYGSDAKLINKAENMKSYIEHQYELYELYRRNKIDSLVIKESLIRSI